MPLVDHDTFFKNLTTLFDSKKDKGSLWITTKRLRHDGQDSTMKHEHEGSNDTREYPCLLRVSDGKRIKFSTKVEPTNLESFFTQYASILKSSMSSSLRKRDKKREKSRAEQATKRRLKMTVPIVLYGPHAHKRGKGRRQRQRKIKALMKQRASQKKFQEREQARKHVAA